MLPVLSVLALSGTAVALADSGGAPPPTSADGRLQGSFALDGRVTVAHNVRGERAGHLLRRRWSFTSSCASGPCDTVSVRRARSGSAADRLTLTRRRPGLYSGPGVFYQALSCHHRRYPRGGRVPFVITVRVANTATVQGAPFATAIRATYVNARRENLTRCSGFLGHDAARYAGPREGALPGPPAGNFAAVQESAPISRTYDFTDTSTAGEGNARVLARQWSFGEPASGDANSSTASNPSHTFTAPGTYTVTLTVRDANGLTSTVSHDVTS
ncbi:MAG: PKD domain-containing protein [Solirubrobacteraceae bacterium]